MRPKQEEVTATQSPLIQPRPLKATILRCSTMPVLHHVAHWCLLQTLP